MSPFMLYLPCCPTSDCHIADIFKPQGSDIVCVIPKPLELVIGRWLGILPMKSLPPSVWMFFVLWCWCPVFVPTSSCARIVKPFGRLHICCLFHASFWWCLCFCITLFDWDMHCVKITARTSVHILINVLLSLLVSRIKVKDSYVGVFSCWWLYSCSHLYDPMGSKTSQVMLVVFCCVYSW